MSSILEGVMQSLGQEGVSAIASRLGINASQAEQAMQSALPLIVGGMARNSATPEGANALHNALQDHSNAPPASQQAQQTNQGDSSLLNEGTAILGHIFGERQDAAANGVSQVSGLDKSSASSLLSMLAPIVMSYVGKELTGNGVNAGQLSSALGDQTGAMPSGKGVTSSLLSSVLDQDGDGKVELSDLASVGESIFSAFNKH